MFSCLIASTALFFEQARRILSLQMPFTRHRQHFLFSQKSCTRILALLPSWSVNCAASRSQHPLSTYLDVLSAEWKFLNRHHHVQYKQAKMCDDDVLVDCPLQSIITFHKPKSSPTTSSTSVLFCLLSSSARLWPSFFIYPTAYQSAFVYCTTEHCLFVVSGTFFALTFLFVHPYLL